MVCKRNLRSKLLCGIFLLLLIGGALVHPTTGMAAPSLQTVGYCSGNPGPCTGARCQVWGELNWNPGPIGQGVWTSEVNVANPQIRGNPVALPFSYSRVFVVKMCGGSFGACNCGSYLCQTEIGWAKAPYQGWPVERQHLYTEVRPPGIYREVRLGQAPVGTHFDYRIRWQDPYWAVEVTRAASENPNYPGWVTNFTWTGFYHASGGIFYGAGSQVINFNPPVDAIGVTQFMDIKYKHNVSGQWTGIGSDWCKVQENPYWIVVVPADQDSWQTYGLN